MTLQRYFKYSTLFVSLVAGLAMPLDMVRRHDVPDSKYLEFGNKFPAVGKVGVQAGDGTLIAPDWVLTAAHVAGGVHRRDGDNFKVYFEGHEEGIETEAFFIHPGYGQTFGHDIALLKLKKSVTNIDPLKFYKQSNENGKDIVIVGHGDFKTGLETEWKMDGLRRAATNRIEAVTDNVIQYKFDKPGDRNVTELEGTAGQGDSGGPALINQNGNWLIAGVSSAGQPGEKGPGTYGAIEHYTRVSTHVTWLNEVLSGKVSPSTAAPKPEGDDGGIVIEVDGGEGMPPIIEGLGLILGQDNDRIMIDGKVDELVPRSLSAIRFGGNDFIHSLNGQRYTDLQKFTKEFRAIKSKESYTISFSLSGTVKKFEIVKN